MIFWFYLFLYVSAFSPRWNETFTFIIQVPELALVRFVVESQNIIAENEFLGQYTLPLLCMGKGNMPKSKMIVLTIITFYQRQTLIYQIALSMTSRYKGDFTYWHMFSLGEITEMCAHMEYGIGLWDQ